MANLATVLTKTAADHPDKVAIRLDDLTVTYGQLDDGTARIAAMLAAKGIGPGDRVGVMLPNVPYFALAYYGALRAGATVVPMNVLLKGRETTFYLSDPEAKLLFAWHDFADAAQTGADEAGAELVLVKPGRVRGPLGPARAPRELVERDDADTAVILYTSGTTGKPKGAELTHANLLANATG
jgi:long-chain acyl-CoA synthetase